MKIEQLTQLLKLPATQASGDAGVKKGQEKATTEDVKSDRLEISNEARSLQATQKQVEQARAEIDAMPDVRADRLAEVSRRIADGYYNRPEVISEITDAVVKSGVLQDEVDARTAVSDMLTGINKSDEVRQEAVDRARERVADGTYDRPEVIQKIAEEMLKNVKNL